MTSLATCLRFDGAAEQAARFYVATLPDSSAGMGHRATVTMAGVDVAAITAARAGGLAA